MQNIKNNNSFVYGPYQSGKKQQIREELGISSNVSYEYDIKNKYIYSLKNNYFHEYILLKDIKQNEIQRIVQSYIEISKNKPFGEKKVHLIFYNIHFVQKLSFIKVLIEKSYHYYNFTFSCNTFNRYLAQFCLPICFKLNICTNFKNLDIDNELYNKCNEIITNILQNDSSNIRNNLYYLLLKCYHFNEIIKQLMDCALNNEQSIIKKSYIIKCATQCEYESLHGNKEIFFLEKFLLLLINNEQ